jgi:DNA-binding SARP family transcriptional activator
MARLYALQGPGNGLGHSGEPENDAPQLNVSLLGGFQVERADLRQAVYDWQRRSAKTLTKLLATEPTHALHREQVLDILWPGVDTGSALNSFGKAIHAARRALEPELPRRKDSSYLKLADAMLVLDTTHVLIDADRFEELADSALSSGDVGTYETALAAYGGELLPEDRYEDWSAARRNYLAEVRIRLLLGLAEEHERRGAYGEAADQLRSVLQQDPARELAHRRLMRLYAEMGTPDQAVRQFRRCEEVLRRELDLAPQRETVTLYREIVARGDPQRATALSSDSGTAAASWLLRSDAAQKRPFVGRERVIQRLFEQLARGANGGPGLVLLSGEAGVGKTRLMAEFAARASREGATVLWGGGGAHANQFVCGPFAVALEGYAADLPEAERNELVRRHPALTRFVPSLQVKGYAPAPGGTTSEDNLEVIPAIARLFTEISASGPFIFVLGDLPDTDPVSLDLLRYLAHLASWRPWLMIAAARDEELDADTGLRRMVDSTIRERLCLKIELRCLSRQGSERLVRALLPAERASAEFLDQVYERSRGNPLFIGELAREAAENDTNAFAAGGHHGARYRESSLDPGPVPARVRALTATQFAALDETARRLLCLAAAVPAPEISLDDYLAAAAALSPPVSDAAFFDALDLALQLHILEEREDGYAFRYPLVRTALFEGLPLHRKAQFRMALRSGAAHAT